MNRTQRRAEARSVPKALRAALNHGKLPIVEITIAQCRQFGLSAKEGDVVTIAGWRRNPDGTGLQRCPKGQETPMRINIVG